MLVDHDAGRDLQPRLRGQFDFIIVDSCPVLPVADALLIGQHVDGVLFSIMQDVSQLPKVLGFVLALIQRRSAGFGGPFALLRSVLCETLASALFAP